MLYESDVVDAVARFLAQHNWVEIRCVENTRDRGVDLVMRQNERVVTIEAKGATSENLNSRRYGKEFDSGQVADHVGGAVLTAMTVASIGVHLAAIAVPDNRLHRLKLGAALPAVLETGIAVFWVADDLHVTADSPWPLGGDS